MHAPSDRQNGRSAGPKANPFLFVVGCPRSGTTLLQRMLDNHPQLAVANDTHFIPRCLEKSAADRLDAACSGADVPLIPELVESVTTYHRFCRLGLPDDVVSRCLEASNSYRGLVTALYTEFGRARNKPLAGEKTPDYVRHLPLLNGLFPRAKIVHIIRDGRDVALSLLEWAHPDRGPGRFQLWQEEPVAVCALWWSWLVRSGRDVGNLLGANVYCEVAYERLVERPVDQLQRIAAFLGIAYSDEMVHYHAGKIRSGAGLSAKSAWLPPTSGLRDWRKEMQPRDLALFEALAGDLLAELGYECADAVIPSDVAGLARSYRRKWESGIARRVRKLKSRTDPRSETRRTS